MTQLYEKKGRRYVPVNDARLTPVQAWGGGGLMAVAAYRYCIGRMTYIPDICADWICNVWPHLPENVRELIKRDAEEVFSRDDAARERGETHLPLGHDCDRATWERIRALWKDTP